MTARWQLLTGVAALVPVAAEDDCVLVAVDGVDGAGKTMFADELAAVLRRAGRLVERISVDDFHQVRAVRYRRGRDSPEGFWLDSFDYDRLREYVLDPLGPGGDRRYRRAAHDLESDAILRPPLQAASPRSVVVIDGLFLHRDGLATRWDLSIWLDAPYEVTAARMAVRDGSNPDLTHPSIARYVEAQRTYQAICDPAGRAHVVIDNSELAQPKLISARAAHMPGSH